MQTFRKIFLMAVLLALLFFTVAFFFVETKGQALLTKTLTDVLRRPVAIEEVHFWPPIGLILKNVKVEGALEAQNVKLQLGLPLFSGPRIVFSYIDVEKPLLTIAKTSERKFVWGQPVGSAEPVNSAALSGQESPALIETPVSAETSAVVSSTTSAPNALQGIAIHHFFINNGTVQFVIPNPQGSSTVAVEQVVLRAKDFNYPLVAVNTEFDFQGKIASSYIFMPGSAVSGHGWINMAEKNMDGVIKIIEPGEVKSVSAKLTSRNNDMDVEGKIYIQHQVSQGQSASLGDFLLGMLQTAGVNLDMRFAFKTKMDDFRVDGVKLYGKAGYEELLKPVQEVSAAVEGAMNQPLPEEKNLVK